MTTATGPPPSSSTADPFTSETSAMGPPPPRIPSSKESSEEHEKGNDSKHPSTAGSSSHTTEMVDNPENGSSDEGGKKLDQRNNNAAVPYTVPEWSGPPLHHFYLEILKDGAIVNQFDVNKKGAYMFGRVDLCDFVLEHPTISRFHAVLQFKSNGGAYIYDLGSTHGTFINKNQVKKRDYVDLHVGDVIRFGHSSRLYIFQGPSELMPPESDLKRLRNAKFRLEMQDMEESLLRAKLEASRADGISWGMREDALEENEDEIDEITWQTYKGQLTEKQEKTREKVIKRLEKVAHMKKEIDSIRVKDISQGGLTQGQQTQIARNEQRMSQIMEELDNLEETLNESIRESLGARAGKLSHGKRKGVTQDDEEDYVSDDDEFYDRTHKSTKHKNIENQSVETADSLLDKKEDLVKQIEDKEKLLQDEDKSSEINEVAEAGDALDAYMSSVSSQLVEDNKEKIRKELSALQSEMDRVIYLLRIADPTGEAAKKRESTGQNPEPIPNKIPSSGTVNRPSVEKNKRINSSAEKRNKSGGSSLVKPVEEVTAVEVKSDPVVGSKKPESATEESTTPAYAVSKPQWLGAVDIKKEDKKSEMPADVQEAGQFVDYKDRATIPSMAESSLENQGLENAAPGLIIRKRKQVEKSKVREDAGSEEINSPSFKAEDAVALLLKHSRGYQASDEEGGHLDADVKPDDQEKNDAKRHKRVLGPERPSFLNEPDHSTWVPPEGQTGDGRTSLNDRLGY